MESTGRGDYLRSLGLRHLELYDAVGNHFDPDALRNRLEGPLARIVRAPQASKHWYLAPADLAVIYRCLAEEVRSCGIPVQASPFPGDVATALSALDEDAQKVQGRSDGVATQAGGRGRFGQCWAAAEYSRGNR